MQWLLIALLNMYYPFPCINPEFFLMPKSIYREVTYCFCNGTYCFYILMNDQDL